MTSGRDRYLNDKIQTARPEQLVKMLFDRAMAELSLAATALRSGDRPGASPHIRLAQDIVGELRCSLDLNVGPIATNLDALYGFAYTQLLEASLDGAPNHLDDVAALLDPLRSAWDEACCGLQPVT